MKFKNMLSTVTDTVLRRKKLEPSKEVHDLKDRLTSISGQTTQSAKEYKEVMEQVRKSGVTFGIAVATGGKKRGL